MPRLLAVYAAATAIPVVLLGVALGVSYRSQAQQRGVAEGRSEALLIAQTAVEPILDARPLSQDMTPVERAGLRRLVDRAVRSQDVLRLRLRGLAGNVVFSDDGSGFKDRPEDEVFDAAHGAVVARLTHLNSDPDDTGPAGPRPWRSTSPCTPAPPLSRSACSSCTFPTRP